MGSDGICELNRPGPSPHSVAGKTASKQANTCLVLDRQQSCVRKLRGLERGGGGASGGRMVREAFIRDLREEKMPASEVQRGQRSRRGRLLSCLPSSSCLVGARARVFAGAELIWVGSPGAGMVAPSSPDPRNIGRGQSQGGLWARGCAALGTALSRNLGLGRRLRRVL